MNEDDAKRLKKRLLFSAVKLGFSEQAEDLSQDSLLQWLESKNRHQTVNQSVIDSIRRANGRPGALSFEQKRNIIKPLYGMDSLENRPSPEINRDSCIDFELLCRKLQSIDQAICNLIFKWGFSEKEVGNLFGVSESRISKKIKGIQKRLLPFVSQGQGEIMEHEKDKEMATGEFWALEIDCEKIF